MVVVVVVVVGHRKIVYYIFHIGLLYLQRKRGRLDDRVVGTSVSHQNGFHWYNMSRRDRNQRTLGTCNGLHWIDNIYIYKRMRLDSIRLDKNVIRRL